MSTLKLMWSWWRDAPPYWRWGIAALIVLPVLLAAFFEFVVRRSVVMPTEAMDQRAASEATKRAADIARLESATDRALKQAETQVAADAAADDASARITVPELAANPAELIEAMQKVDKGEPL